ncbi:PAS domain S-box protein [Bradyrhizobium manausense]|uniref:PAS domain-containing sensor histidine kinase n=1 Tax=Bradyrhizobium manausense TaxID=989370 RepID=UPI001BABC146|nr:PAS domain-containing sensor histidine kinase [Bradyrhizobium manausense]MBR0827147.1 PAS domain S-box protein [Bradyrhizobium manausense]
MPHPSHKGTGFLDPDEKELSRNDGNRVPVLLESPTLESKQAVSPEPARKPAEEALKESEERFRTLVQFSFDVYWETDAQHRFIRQEFSEALPEAPASEIGKTRWEVPYLEPDAEAWRKHRETLDAHLPFRDFELARPTADGGKRYVSVSGLPAFDETGRFIGYRGVGRHITATKRAEEALRGSEARFRTFVDHATDAFMLHNEDGTVLDVNRNACDSLGYSRDELIGKTAFDYNLDLNPLVWHRNREHLKAGGIATFESRHLRKDGAVFPVEVRMREFCQGHQRLIISLSRDITERKRAAEALREMQGELTHANRAAAMGQLTASIAHEVSQPLTAILCNAEAALGWLGSQASNVEAQQALAGIIKDAHRAGEVIDWIRALIKKAPAPIDRIDVNSAILDVVAMARSELLRHGISLQTDLTADLPRIEGYRVQLQQVVLNLILNAVEAMSGVDEGMRKLQISTDADTSNAVLVAVRDTGPGVDPAIENRLFEPFNTTKPDGMGVGLAICSSIIESHGGRLWVELNKPRGAVFQFTLRARPPTTEPSCDFGHEYGLLSS